MKTVRHWLARGCSNAAATDRGRRATSRLIHTRIHTIEAMAMNEPAVTATQAKPGAAYRALQTEIDAAVARTLQSGWYLLGQELRSFEAEFAAWLGTGA